MSSASELDIINNTVCRTCLQTGHLTSLDDAYCAAMCLGEMLTFCTRVKMPAANDKLPTHICQDCLCELNQAYTFVLKCQKSDDKLRNHLNKNINTSAVAQISRRNYGISHTDGICVRTEEAANINSPNVINTIQNTNDDNSNVKLEADLTLGISDLFMKQENVKAFEDGRCSGDDFKSPNFNDRFECINDFKLSLREPLPTSAIQTDLDQELDVIKHEIGCDVKLEMQRYINYRNKDIDVNRASVNPHENDTEPKLCRQSTKLLPEKETKTKIIFVPTKAKNALSSCVNSIEFTKSHNMNSVNTVAITSNQPENAMYMKNAVVILEDINVHLKSLSSDRQNSKINDQYCTKMPVKPYRVKRKNKSRAINTTEETSKPANPRLRRHQVHISYTCKCTVCEKSFNNKRELRYHTMTHTRESLYPPDDNVKSNTGKEGGTHHVLGKKSFVCTFCGKVFTGKTGLNRHMHTHTGEKPFSCATCDKTFTQKRSLTIHKLTHTGEKPYLCVTCDKTFTRKGSLTNHMLIHTGEKPYSCVTCGKRFNFKDNLTVHMFTHTGEKPYSCATCGKTFCRRGHVTVHMLTHTGEKPYSCTTCNKTFNYSSNLTRHMLIHTRDKPYSYATSDKTFNHTESLTRYVDTHRK